MVMKKSGPPAPKDSSRFKVSEALTVLGRTQRGVPGMAREAISDAQLTKLKSMVAKIDADKAKAAKEAAKNAKIIKTQNKQKPLRPSGPTKPISSDIFKKPKPIIKVKPRGPGMGGMLGGSLTSRTK